MQMMAHAGDSILLMGHVLPLFGRWWLSHARNFIPTSNNLTMTEMMVQTILIASTIQLKHTTVSSTIAHQPTERESVQVNKTWLQQNNESDWN